MMVFPSVRNGFSVRFADSLPLDPFCLPATLLLFVYMPRPINLISARHRCACRQVKESLRSRNWLDCAALRMVRNRKPRKLTRLRHPARGDQSIKIAGATRREGGGVMALPAGSLIGWVVKA